MDMATKKKAEQIFNRVIKIVKPSNNEIQNSIKCANEIMGMLKGIVGKEVELRVVGSLAKATNLRGSADIDIFMLFKKTLHKEDITKKGLEYSRALCKARKNTKYEIKYAEHPYAKLHLDDYGINVDIVPAYKLDNISEMGTAVDRSPLHTEFINSNLNDKQRDDVRVLKYLLKSHGIYGAEVRIKGLSGYLCELLIHQFGSLIGLLEYMSSVKLPVCLKPLNRSVAYDESIKKKFTSEFIVIDPVDENRNVAASVSSEALAKFALISKMFISEPNISLIYVKMPAADRA